MRLKAPIFINCCFFLFILVSTSSAQIFFPKTIIGRWEGIDSTNQIGNIEFLDSLHLRLSIPGQGTFVSEYSFDTTKNPIWFDIILKNGDKKAILKGLVKFLDNNTLKWQIFLDGERTNSFQDETFDNTIILKKRNDGS
jgi:hypothetical protein